jgi:hypothetical protein
MTLSDHTGKQIISDTTQKRYRQDFQTILIVVLQHCEWLMTLFDHEGKQIISDTALQARFSNNVYCGFAAL